MFNKYTFEPGNGTLSSPAYKYRIYLFIIILVAIFLTLPCQIKAEGFNQGTNDYNVILIVISALRADHLGFNGYNRDTSPNIDSLARGGISFTNAISQSYWTLPSITSILTSKFVSMHQVDARDKKLPNEEMTLSEILKLYSYSTAAFTCGLDTSAVYGLNQGFDIYYDSSGKDSMGSISGIINPAIRWLRKNKERRFFLFLQSYDVHPPYRGPYENKFDGSYKGLLDNLCLDYAILRKIKGKTVSIRGKSINLAKKDIKHIIAHYDGGIRYVDKFVGRLIEEVKHLKLDNKTIIVLCADHGEELGERGQFDRFGNRSLYQETIRVPLVIKYPGSKFGGIKSNSLVELVDLSPTILEFLGIPIFRSMQGKSLVPLIKAGKNNNHIFLNKYAYCEATHDKWAIINPEGFKLIYSAGHRELYNLKNDPQEQNNLSDRYLDIQAGLMKEFFAWRKGMERSDGAERIELSAQMIRKLKSAGYWP